MVKKGQILIFIKSTPLICQNEALDVSFSELLISRGQGWNDNQNPLMSLVLLEVVGSQTFHKSLAPLDVEG